MYRPSHALKSAAATIIAVLLAFVLVLSPVLSAGNATPVFLNMWGSFGLGDGKFFYPYGIDATGGKVYVADTENDRLQVFNLDGSSPVATPNGLLTAPRGVTVASDGSIYIADTGANRVVKLSPSFIVQWAVGVSGSGFSADPGSPLVQMRRPSDVALDEVNNYLYVADTYNNRVLQLSLSGIPLNVWGGPAGGSGDNQFSMPSGIAVDGDGAVYVADTYNHRIVKHIPTGVRTGTWGVVGSGDGQFFQPRSVALASGYLYVADTGNHRIQKFSALGEFVGTWGSAGTAQARFNNPYALAVIDTDYVFVADTFNDRVQVFEPDLAPTSLSIEDNIVQESQPVGTAIDVFSTVDPNGGENTADFTYTLVSTLTGDLSQQSCVDNAAFSISGNTLRSAVILDFETQQFYTICVRVTDTGGLYYETALEIEVTDGSDKPVLNDTSFSLNENSPTNALIGPLVATDNDLNEDLTFTVQDGSYSDGFSVEKTGAMTAELRVNDAAVFNYEAFTDHQVTVGILVTDKLGLTSLALVTVLLQNVNDPPQLSAPSAPFSIEENIARYASVGNITFTDEDSPAQTVTLTRTPTSFLVSATGEITVNNVPNYETTKFVNLKITAADNGDPVQTSSITVTINITDVNEPPTLVNKTIPENSPVGTKISTGTDPELDRIYYTLNSDNSGGAFEINADGELVVKDSTRLDYESLPSTARYFTLNLTATDNITPPVTNTALRITLSNVNEPPALDVVPLNVNENTATGATVGTVTASDPENHNRTFTSTDTTGPFLIETNGTVKVRNSALLDHEVLPSYSLLVKVNDSTNMSDTQLIPINIIDVNEAPVVTLSTTALSLAEHSSPVTALATASAVDEDEGQSVTFTISGGDPHGALSIDPNNGIITIANQQAFNYEQLPIMQVEVTGTDSGDPVLATTVTLTVTLTNINEVPIISTSTLSILEGSLNGTLVGAVVASDPDAGSVLTYAITGGTGASVFAINSASGAVTVKDQSKLIFLQNPTFSLIVQVTDNAASPLTTTATVTVSVLAMADPAITTFSAPTPALINSHVPVTLVISNLGGGASGSYKARVFLPQGISFLSSGSSPACTLSGVTTVDCNGSSLAGLSQQNLTLIMVPNQNLANNTQLSFYVLLTTPGADIAGNNEGSLSITAVNPLVVTDHNFETNQIPGWFRATPSGDVPLTFSSNTSVTPTGGRRFLGRFSEADRVSLQFSNLPAHGSIEVSFDLYVIGSWDGNGAPGTDFWKFSYDGSTPLVNTTFSNFSDAQHLQAFPQNYGLGENLGMTGSVERKTLGYMDEEIGMDSVYTFTFTIPHTSPDLKLLFESFGLQGLSDESWGLDNVHVSLYAVKGNTVYLPFTIR